MATPESTCHCWKMGLELSTQVTKSKSCVCTCPHVHMSGRNFTQDFSLFRKKGTPGIRDSDVGLLHNNKHGGEWSGDQNSVQKVNSWQGNKEIAVCVTLQEHWVPPVRDLHPADHAARHRLSNFLFRGPRLHGRRKMVHNVLCTMRILCSVAYYQK